MKARSWLLAGLLIAGLLVAGCSPTTYTDAAATTESLAPTTTAAPSNDPEVALPLMLTEVTDLARRVAESDGDGAAATRIEQLWSAIAPTVSDERPELVSGFDFVVRRCRAAADRNRPADADRALKNLQTLVDEYLDA